MALDCNTAFGRYLRALRERRPLSLDEVESLSQTFPDPINKGYLSRCENGKQLPAFGKVIALSRIYEVPPEVLVERMELDMELDRMGGPDTERKSFAELYALGKDAFVRGVVWEAYAYARDAAQVAHQGEVIEVFADRSEQILRAVMNVATTALKVGKARFACHEFHYVFDAKGDSERLSSLALDRLARAYFHLRDLERARQYADNAIQAAEQSSSREFLGYMYTNRAAIAEEESDYSLAAGLYQKAYRLYRDANLMHDCAAVLVSLARAYIGLTRYRSARRSLAAAAKLADKLAMERSRAFIRLLLGEIDELEGKTESAAARWRETIKMAKKNNDRLLRFRAELLLYRQALSAGNLPTARALERRLKRLSPLISENIEELAEFRRLVAKHGPAVTRRVATTQPLSSPHRNS